ncbi:MAG TPA: hypothetical protein VMT19_06090 [Thermoanaerobaculaceae bacterium]|nr:hypothetical protein [Thermoanaerobaculaceae bacterium]
MRPRVRLLLAAVPGIAVAVAALLGWVPTGQDLPSYFVPLRHRTAEVFAGSRSAFWNPDVGCGEPFFSNPQSGLLYPLVWPAIVLPPQVAVGLEAGVHLAILAVGCTLLARRLGAKQWLDLVAGWGVVVAGPVLGSAGVLNNLDSLAWTPWIWWAALGGSLPATAGFVALAYLAAEPQLAAIAGVVALTLAPRRRTVAAVVLAMGLVAVQALPFAAWVRGGDRGPRDEPQIGMAGVVMPGELVAMAVPGAPMPDRIGARFVEHFAVPLWALVLGAVAALDKRRAVRHLAWWAWALIAWSVLPSLPWGLAAWNFGTAGLVRYPGRLLFPAVVALVPAAAAAIGTRRPKAWVGAAVALTAAIAGTVLSRSYIDVVLGAVAAGGALVAPVAAPAALVGTLATGWRAPEALSVQPVDYSERAMCLDAQRGAARVYPVGPSWQQLNWIQERRQVRLRSLCLGYTAVMDGRRSARTFGPLASRALDAHLKEADRGPGGRWWLDALGADRIVSQHRVPGFSEVCRDGDLVVYENRQAWPIVSLACGVPRPGEALRLCGDVRTEADGDDRHTWNVTAGPGGGVLLWLETPDPGWQFRVDGRLGREVKGMGILHGVEVPAGAHTVTARYRPTWLLPGAAVSLLSLGLLAGAVWRRW